MSKPTIEELEAILNSEEDIAVRILANGEVTWPADVSKEIKQCPRCKRNYLKEVQFFDGFCSLNCLAPTKRCPTCGQDVKHPKL